MPRRTGPSWLFRKPPIDRVPCLGLLIIFLLFTPCHAFEDPPSVPEPEDPISIVKSLLAEERWQAIVDFVDASPDHPPELDFYRGLALARLERWKEAIEAFERGQQKRPTDKRFPLELAGVAFKQGANHAARRHLERALSLDSADPYGNEFMATLYFLDDNLEAALKYWNRAGKPEIANILPEKGLRVDPVLLDHAFAFSPASVLDLDAFRTTRSRLALLDIFPRFRLELLARPDRKFDVHLRCEERNGWGNNKIEGLASLFRGAPFQTIHPEFYNLGQSARNFISLLRIDAQKRRYFASFSAPVRRDPGWRYRVYVDGRRETWDVSRTAQEPRLKESDIWVRTLVAGAEIQSKPSGRWGWNTGLSFANRSFPGGRTEDPSRFFDEGVSLKYRIGADRLLLSIPERRITSRSFASLEVARVLTESRRTFSKLQSGLETRWFPHASGEDYVVTSRLRAGKTWGDSPFDELFFLAVERDTELWMRGHRGTRHRKKGNGPLGRDYILTSWEIEKILFKNSLLELRIVPFLDAGKAFDDTGNFGSPKWLWDTGAQLKVDVQNRLTLVLTYGKDLRTGRNAVHGSVTR